MEQKKEETIEKDLTNIDYIEEINKLKANTVTKDEYNKLVGENKKLLDSILNGSGEGGGSKENEIKLESSETYRKMLGEDMTNLDYITTCLNLREAVLAEGGEDPFCMSNTEGNISDEQRESAERVAEGLKFMVAEADGDPDYFRILYNKGVVDPVGVGMRNKKKK